MKKIFLVVLFIALVGIFLGVNKISDVQAGTPVFHWDLIFSDEFNDQSFDTNKWTAEDGSYVGYMNPDNIHEIGGVLRIDGTDESYNGYNYSSGSIISKNKFETGPRTEGVKIEIRAQVPTTQDLYPAFWMWPADSPDPDWWNMGEGYEWEDGEIDIMERWDSLPADTWKVTAHTGAPIQHYGAACTNHMGGNHIYSFEWYPKETGIKPGELKWYKDGVLCKDLIDWYSSDPTYGHPFDDPFFLIIELFLGDLYGNPPDITKLPGYLYIDYVRVYEGDW